MDEIEKCKFFKQGCFKEREEKKPELIESR